nr:GNAT family N-acetyltransferase [uncultured Oscillibacter sp.]
MIIREYRPEDCPRLTELFHQTVHTVNAADYTPAQLEAWAPGGAELRDWDRSFRAHYTLVALEGGEIAGFGDLDTETGYLDRLYVRWDLQGRGVASALCDRLEGRAAGRIVTHASITARPFFEKRGYRTLARQQVERRGIYLTNYIMEKQEELPRMNHFKEIAAALDSRGLDAMLLSCEANRFYASGFHSSGTDGMALVTRNRNYYFTDSRYTEAAGRAVRDAELREVGGRIGYSTRLKEAIAEQSIERMGYEDAYMTVKEYETYRQALPCELVPAAELLQELRRVKDREELAVMTAAQRIAERALEDILKEIRPGVTEREIAARLQYLMLHYGAENMSFDPIVVSGPNGSLPHGVPSEREIRSGEFVTMDFGCIYRGYCSDMTRTVAVGSVTEEMRAVYETVLAAQKAGIAAARAGVTGRDVDGAARQVIADAGYGAYFGHGFGHGVGVEIHEAPTASSANDKPLPAGAVISAEPGIYLPGKLGVRIEDVIVITEDGCENLTRAPKELLIL